MPDSVAKQQIRAFAVLSGDPRRSLDLVRSPYAERDLASDVTTDLIDQAQTCHRVVNVANGKLKVTQSASEN